jgi:uncharacterized membrane protein
MNLSYAQIKDFAIAKLGNNKWGEAIGVTFIFFAITWVLSIVPFGIATLIVGGPLALGVTTYFLKLNRGQSVSINDMFSGFQNFGNALVVSLISAVITVVICLIFLIPIALLLVFSFGVNSQNLLDVEGIRDLDPKIFAILGLGILLLMIPLIIVTIGLSQSYRILHDEPNISATDAMRKSWELMKNRKMDYFLFNLSFIGWILLAGLTCGLGMLALYPYMQVANAKYYDEISGGGQREIDSIGEDLGKL